MGRGRLSIIFTAKFALIALVFALLFSVIAGLQYLYVKTQLSQASTATLTDWTNQVSQAINYADNNSWNITQYRQAAISAERYIVLARDGTVVDIQGFVPGVITKVNIPFAYKAATPLGVTSSIEEHWRVAVYELQGGKLILGISDLDQVPTANDLLASTSHIFGSSLQDALKVNPRLVDINVDYAIVADDGTLKYASGGTPLKVISSSVTADGKGLTSKQLTLDHQTYEAAVQPITDKSGKAVGTIITTRSIDAELQTLSHQLYFNGLVAGIAFILTLLLFALYALRTGLGKKERFVPLEEALRRSEGQDIEFKEMLPSLGDKRAGDKDGLKRLATALAAFANTNAGNVFLGVSDQGEVRGLEVGTPKEKEHALEIVKNLIRDYISPVVTPEVGWVEHDGKTVMHMYVPRGDQPIYYVDGTIYVRHLAFVQIARPELVETMVKRFYGRRRGF